MGVGLSKTKGVSMPTLIAVGVIVALLAIWIGAEIVLTEASRKVTQIVDDEAPRPHLNSEGGSDE